MTDNPFQITPENYNKVHEKYFAVGPEESAEIMKQQRKRFFLTKADIELLQKSLVDRIIRLNVHRHKMTKEEYDADVFEAERFGYMLEDLKDKFHARKDKKE